MAPWQGQALRRRSTPCGQVCCVCPPIACLEQCQPCKDLGGCPPQCLGAPGESFLQFLFQTSLGQIWKLRTGFSSLLSQRGAHPRRDQAWWRGQCRLSAGGVQETRSKVVKMIDNGSQREKMGPGGAGRLGLGVTAQEGAEFFEKRMGNWWKRDFMVKWRCRQL